MTDTQTTLGNGYMFIMNEGDCLDEPLTDCLIDCEWLEDATTFIVGADNSYDSIKLNFMFLREQLHQLKGVYLYNRHPLLVKWVCDAVREWKLDCEVWVNIEDNCWYGVQ